MNTKHSVLKNLIVAGSLPLCLAADLNAAAVPAQTKDVPVLEDTIVVDKKKTENPIRYSYLGIALDALPAATSLESAAPGVQVIYVLQSSPAWDAGIRTGDILLTLDGQKLFFPNQFSALVRSYKPGDEVEIEFLRNGEKLTKKVVVGERRIRSVQRKARSDSSKALPDDIRIYINGREHSLTDGSDFDGWISVTPHGILIRDTLDIPAEFRRLVQRVHSKIPDSQKMLSALKKQYDEARNAALSKARQTFSQVFFGHGNSVIIVGDENGRQVTVSRADDDKVLFRGPCSTQADIDAIPPEAKQIIDTFTVLKPMKTESAEVAPEQAEPPAPQMQPDAAVQ